MKTLLPSEITDADRPFVYAHGNADGTVTLYYEGEPRPVRNDPPPPPSKWVSAQQFRDAFTTAELAGILASADANVRLLVFKIQTNRDGFDLLSADVQGGLAYLVSKGLLAAGRPAQISG